ncbi:hypothetical protein WN943_009281 [Citrus x changshan-huyou]
MSQCISMPHLVAMQIGSVLEFIIPLFKNYSKCFVELVLLMLQVNLAGFLNMVCLVDGNVQENFMKWSIRLELRSSRLTGIFEGEPKQCERS